MSKQLTFKDEQQLLEHYEADKDNNQVVSYQGNVYDVKEYMPQHPGGEEYISKLLGKPIDEEFDDAEHTKSAKNLMKDLPMIGKLLSDKDSTNSEGEKEEKEMNVGSLYGTKMSATLKEKLNIDYTKGIMYQVFKANLTFDEYVLYINEPKHLVNPVRDIRLFENGFLELCSQSPWWGVILAWLPAIVYFFYNATQQPSWDSPVLCVALFILGMLGWSFTEYFLHRFFFHGEDHWMHYVPHNTWVFTAHFTIHGIHHAFPQDRLRLVFPPIPGYLIGYFMIIKPCSMVVPENYFYISMAGWVIGYLLYDEIHYFLHHSSPKAGYWKDMKLYHMQHHYKFGQIGFGVSSKLWDIVF